ncbi:MAG: molybdopterin-dependent oxidoreductase [Candidatus Tectomicrobia bacterium]|uniref:Molybdopterin-dependent oxidoreductase n=1 Tax=Tectimicrobiota bacterium TaxID=2528274 RepID=A0A932M0Y2_UNCTE|nr:molybdopterin-dependent oxidoreductase [Candidatus Tectomicrobia bacterium]
MGGIDRRDFLKVIGIGGATAVLAGCSSQKPENVIPYLVPPENPHLGLSLWYATTCRECPAGCGLLVRTQDGRALKVEGNPSHPVNQGRICARGQSSVQGLYNPDRIRQPLRRKGDGLFEPIDWVQAEKIVAERLAALLEKETSSRVACITPLLTGTLDRLFDAWLAGLGSKLRYSYEAFSYEPLRAANRLTFDQDAIPDYDLSQAQMILSFGCDFLETWVSPVSFSAQYARMRTFRNGTMGTFVHVGPRLSMTGANADEWIPAKPGADLYVALGMVREILAQGSSPLPAAEREMIARLAAPYDPKTVESRSEVPPATLKRLARQFAKARPGLALGGAVASSGRNATPTQVAINLVNYVTGNVGRTVHFGSSSSLGRLSTYQDMLGLVERMNRGEIEVLFLYQVNPLFTLPESAGFREAIKKVPMVVSLSSFPDETTAQAHVVLPDHSPLESWGDFSPRQGVHGLIQPVMKPLFDTKAAGDTLLSVARHVGGKLVQALPQESFYEALRGDWKKIYRASASAEDFETFWENALRAGGVWSEPKKRGVRLSSQIARVDFSEPSFDGDDPAALALTLYPSINHFDGRGANRPWLQEIPDPVIQAAWDNWVEIHPETAKKLGITSGDLVEVKSSHGRIELPVYLYEWIRRDTVAIPIGQGHEEFGRYAKGRGANPIRLLGPKAEGGSGGLPWLSVKVTMKNTGKRYLLTPVAGSNTQYGRPISLAVSLSDLLKEEHPESEAHPSMYAPHPHPKHRWGMTIDLNACTGCSSCVAACYAENNLGIVGKEEMMRGRETSWIRLERFMEGRSPENPDFRFSPMLCQHCDSAPCEPVCPVYATYHTTEGLNAQIYNRCVGTRYCANNCPYKVRRFNWFTYQWPEPLNLQLNPDVTVREKGVMEKCTFCVQRIRRVEIKAQVEGRAVRDGEIQPACAQACPTEAIVFGDLNDAGSDVSKRARDPRRYRALEEINTHPAITYLKRIRVDSEEG